MHRSIGPVRRPLAVALHNIHKLPSNDAVGLLTRVQLVVPHEGVRARIDSAVEVRVTGDIKRRGAVKVVGRVVVNIRQLWH